MSLELHVLLLSPHMAFTGRSAERRVVNAPTQPPLAVGKQHGNGDPLRMLDIHPNRVAGFAWDGHIRNERRRADRRSLRAGTLVQTVQDIHRRRLLPAVLGCCQSNRAVTVHDRPERKEGAMLVKLLLSERKQRAQEPIQVVLTLLRGLIAPRSHGGRFSHAAPQGNSGAKAD